jgi:flavodoxin I
MTKIGVFYGSTTGATQTVAERIAEELGVESMDIRDIDPLELTDYDLLVLGCSTWGDGEIQRHWKAFLPELAKLNLEEKAVALFGSGDQRVYDTTFVDGIGVLYETLARQGVKFVGFWPVHGYDFRESKAMRAGHFVGLPLDDDNQPELTSSRIETWTKLIRAGV